MKYEILDEITSDVMIRAYGKTLEELIENCGEAISSVICDIKKVRKNKDLIIHVEGEDERELIHNWLSKLLSSIDIENMFFSKFKVLELNKNGNYSLKVKCSGEEIREELLITIAKAVTYYKYNVEKTKDMWIATFVVDI